MQTFEKQTAPVSASPIASTAPVADTSGSSNTVSIANVPKKEIAAVVKPENPATENTASAVTAIIPSTTTTQTESTQTNWFIGLLERIF